MADSTDTKDTSDMEKYYDEMFAYRYTEEDTDYVQVTSKPIPPCPCVSGYFLRPKKNYNNRGRDNRQFDDRRNDGRGQWGNRGGRYGDNRHRSWSGNRNQDYRGQDESSYRRNYNDDRHDRGHYGQRYNPY